MPFRCLGELESCPVLWATQRESHARLFLVKKALVKESLRCLFLFSKGIPRVATASKRPLDSLGVKH